MSDDESAANGAVDEAARVLRFTEPGDGSVNSWLIVSARAAVLIDAQRSLSAGAALASLIATHTGRLDAVLLTHPHPDHFGGLESVLSAFPGTPVYASKETTRMMRADENGLIALTKKVLLDDAPDTQPIPNQSAEHGSTLRFGDIALEVDEIGPGEAGAMSMFYAPREHALFCGDIVDNQFTSFVLEGRSSLWLAQIDAVQGRYAERAPTIYPGHGAAGGAAMFDGQRVWLETLRALVAERLATEIDDTAAAEIASLMAARFLDHPPVAAIPNLMAENVKAVARELAG